MQRARLPKLVDVETVAQKRKPGWFARFLLASSWMRLHRSAARLALSLASGWVRASPVARNVLPQANPETSRSEKTDSWRDANQMPSAQFKYRLPSIMLSN